MTPVSDRVSNISHFLTKSAARWPDRPAIIWGERRWTWRELDARVSALARAMREDLGLGEGAMVLVQTPNGNEITEVMMAAFRIGAVWVPANFRQAPGETAYNAEKVRADAFFHDPAFAEHAGVVRGVRPDVRCVATGDDYESLIARHADARVPNAPVSRDHPCWLFFTSGSTGRPKAVVLTHGQIGFVIVNHSADLMPGTTERDASLVVAPLSHGAGIHQMVQFATGTPSVLLPPGPFDPATAWRLVEEHRVSNMFTVPTIVKMLVEDPSVDRFDHSSLRHVIYAGAPMYRRDQVTALQKLGPVLVQYYGLGEVTGAITVQRAQDHSLNDAEARAGTCGTERMGLTVSVQDEQGREVPPGETGEICVTGSAVCAGYFEDDGANAKAFRDGWFRTGDLGHMDAERFFYITGRASDMYISGGSNVYPREVEEVLLEHPALNEVAIVGVPDERWGEVGVAVCVAEPDESLTEEELRAHLEARVAKYKRPARYVFLDALPRSGYGKITKKLVREHLDALGLL